ncbi:GlsB/YeaQ/YmgE family stress response membrane protein [Raineyella fluvialis]|uniref:GlsB/YeaQ/YmgE family stress response membrane protein n=1 Tax=Raineyella fluvialis TaxID=2662261 RepID=A0A5Q2FE63_9ACTN|nr:GlsB/YeaQ/YmgE family stress response membrane protein [Raineyella fluvialis]QGF22536.1 GlsB/YeaQ/YmgE family stress response membrane protein [Raineyella fluvialis]
MSTAFVVPLVTGLGLSWISVIIIGLIAGAIAKAILPGNDPTGWIMSLVLGVLGAFVGGWIAQMFGYGGGGFFSPLVWVFAIIGCVIVLLIYGLITKRRV